MGQPHQSRGHSLLATFPDGPAAEQAVSRLRAEGFPDDTISLEQRDRSTPVDEAEMLDEVDAMEAGPGIVATKSMTSGGVKGAVLGGILGAILGSAVAFFSFGGAGAQLGPFLATIIAFAVGGGVAGGVAGGFVKPREHPAPPDKADHEDPHEVREVVLTVSLDDERALERADHLVRSSAIRVDHVGPEGEVLGTERTSADHSPRPGT